MEKSSSTDGHERYRVRSVERALDVLEVLAETDSHGLRLSELARLLDTSKSTVLAVLRTLTARGFVAELGEGRARRYRLGLTLARLGDQVLGQIDLLDLALPSLRAMTEETGWTSRFGVLDEAFAVMIGRVDGPGLIRFQSNLARRELPHCSAIGKALLSHLPEEHVRSIVARTGLPARTATTITDIEHLLRELAGVRAKEFAVDDEEDNEGVFCVGAAVFDHRQSCVAAISLTGLKLTLPAGGIDGLGEVVRRYAAEISATLGAVPAPV
ncbi:MAG: IclR family transcriptional regulator [Gaiellaceae bacterium MAG52_C11]|nr:IclR family transcriptional regulator [Candidatus Gaiellasilicea maunaloa]